MSDEELAADITWLYGGHDQFQHDDVRKDRASKALRADAKQATRVLTAVARELLKPPFTIEDVAAFIEFFDEEMDYSL